MEVNYNVSICIESPAENLKFSWIDLIHETYPSFLNILSM